MKRRDPPFDRFKAADLVPRTPDYYTSRRLSQEDAERAIENEKVGTDWLNAIYHVRRVDCGDMWWLSIKRIDRRPIHDWRHLHRIKNDLVGPEHEGVELYPAESRLADSANQYHLWVFKDPTRRFPFGFQDRLVGGPEEAAVLGAVQRPFEEQPQ